MRAAIQRNDARHALEFVHDHQVILVLHELHRVGREHARWKTGGHAELARLVVARIAGGRLEERLASGLERRHFLVIENRGRALAAIAAVRLRPFVYAAEIRLAIGGRGAALWSARELGALRLQTRGRENQPGQHGSERDDAVRSQSSDAELMMVSLLLSRLESGSWLAVNTWRPSGNVTFVPLALSEPSLARKPSTLIIIPGWITSLVMPRRMSCPGAPPENAQWVTLPSAVFSST